MLYCNKCAVILLHRVTLHVTLYHKYGEAMFDFTVHRGQGKPQVPMLYCNRCNDFITTTEYYWMTLHTTQEYPMDIIHGGNTLLQEVQCAVPTV